MANPIDNNGNAQSPAEEQNPAAIYSGKYNTVNTLNSGQLGMGRHLATLDGATPLYNSNAYAVVLSLPNILGDAGGKILKSLVERHAKTIDGIESSVSLDAVEGFTFQDGQPLEIPGKATVNSISPSITFPEYSGRPVRSFWKMYSELLVNPHTQHSSIGSYLPSEQIDSQGPLVISNYSFSMLMIQYDWTMLPENITDAAMVINMWPKEVPAVSFKRDMSSGAEQQEVSIPFSGIIINNAQTRNLAIKLAEQMSAHSINFGYEDLGISADDITRVTSAENGIMKEAREMVAGWNSNNAI